MDKNTKLLNEIRLKMFYDLKKTFSENNNIINEQNKISKEKASDILNFVKTGQPTTKTTTKKQISPEEKSLSDLRQKELVKSLQKKLEDKKNEKAKTELAWDPVKKIYYQKEITGGTQTQEKYWNNPYYVYDTDQKKWVPLTYKTAKFRKNEYGLNLPYGWIESDYNLYIDAVGKLEMSAKSDPKKFIEDTSYKASLEDPTENSKIIKKLRDQYSPDETINLDNALKAWLEYAKKKLLKEYELKYRNPAFIAGISPEQKKFFDSKLKEWDKKTEEEISKFKKEGRKILLDKEWREKYIDSVENTIPKEMGELSYVVDQNQSLVNQIKNATSGLENWVYFKKTGDKTYKLLRKDVWMDNKDYSTQGDIIPADVLFPNVSYLRDLNGNKTTDISFLPKSFEDLGPSGGLKFINKYYNQVDLYYKDDAPPKGDRWCVTYFKDWKRQQMSYLESKQKYNQNDFFKYNPSSNPEDCVLPMNRFLWYKYKVKPPFWNQEDELQNRINKSTGQETGGYEIVPYVENKYGFREYPSVGRNKKAIFFKYSDSLEYLSSVNPKDPRIQELIKKYTDVKSAVTKDLKDGNVITVGKQGRPSENRYSEWNLPNDVIEDKIKSFYEQKKLLMYMIFGYNPNWEEEVEKLDWTEWDYWWEENKWWVELAAFILLDVISGHLSTFVLTGRLAIVGLRIIETGRTALSSVEGTVRLAKMIQLANRVGLPVALGANQYLKKGEMTSEAFTYFCFAILPYVHELWQIPKNLARKELCESVISKLGQVGNITDPKNFKTFAGLLTNEEKEALAYVLTNPSDRLRAGITKFGDDVGAAYGTELEQKVLKLEKDWNKGNEASRVFVDVPKVGTFKILPQMTLKEIPPKIKNPILRGLFSLAKLPITFGVLFVHDMSFIHLLKTISDGLDITEMSKKEEMVALFTELSKERGGLPTDDLVGLLLNYAIALSDNPKKAADELMEIAKLKTEQMNDPNDLNITMENYKETLTELEKRGVGGDLKVFVKTEVDPDKDAEIQASQVLKNFIEKYD